MARILVVDDSKFMQLTLKIMLEKGGVHKVVGEASEDVSALEKYKELKPDLVTMDIIMPVESGLKAVKNILAFDPKAKIIMTSAMGQDKIIKESLQLGAKGFVVKPVVAEKLLETVDKVLKES